MHDEPRPLSRPSAVVVILAAAFVMLVYFGWKYSDIVERHDGDSAVSRVVGRTALFVLWLFCIPILFAAAKRWPLVPGRRLRNATTLIALAIAFSAARAVMDHGIWWLVRGGRPSSNFWPAVLLLFHTELLIAVSLFVLTKAARLSRENAERRAAEARLHATLAQARLQKLRADVDPHFLFNALNAVAALVDSDPVAARRVMSELTELLRASLATHETASVPLSSELEFVRRYLAIQRVRLGPMLTATLTLCDEELANAEIPPLLLQPLVENSIVHGVGKRPEGGCITVAVDAVGDSLRIQVRDNGPGWPREAREATNSVGIPNARERLLCLYGNQQSLTFRRVDGDFVAEIRIPLRWKQAA